MKISNSYVYSNSYARYNPRFGDTSINSETKYAKDRRTHYTKVGRDSTIISREKIANYVLDLTNKEQRPIEMLFCGCSDGSEPFDFTIAVHDFFKKNQVPDTKFPVINAFDTSDLMVSTAQKGRINISKGGLDWLYSLYGKTYFTPCDKLYIWLDEDPDFVKGMGFKRSQQLDKEIHSKINVYKSDVLTELKKLRADGPKVVFCRNLAQYNGLEDQTKMAELLNERLKKDSLVVVGLGDAHYPTATGNFDGMTDEAVMRLKPLKFIETLKKLGFEHCKELCSMDMVFRKL